MAGKFLVRWRNPCRFGPAQRMAPALLMIGTDPAHPSLHDASVLPDRETERLMLSAREEVPVAAAMPGFWPARDPGRRARDDERAPGTAGGVTNSHL